MKFNLPLTVRIYECGNDGKLKISGLLNYMQEIAALHTVDLKISIPDLLPRGLTWMLSRYHIVIDRYPRFREPVGMSTWIAGHSGYFSIRDYCMQSENGESLARITSSWVLYGIKEKKIVLLEEALPLKDIVHERALEDNFPSLPALQEVHAEAHFQIRRHDLDINKHVNNRVIVEWALETVPPAIAATHVLTELEITFKEQAFYGDPVLSQCELRYTGEQMTALHHILNSNGNILIARLRTQWKKTETGQFEFS
ncbi:MAG: hypothetical protein K0B52_02420 [FCB group bacterium]|nr:hypothetical protein [FCB group bacterium]